MDTLETSTEIELAGVALDLVDDPRDVVIGGLGLGFTLQRMLADVRVERATVVEIEESLVALDARRHGAARPGAARRPAGADRQRRHPDGDRGGARHPRPAAARRRQRPGLPRARQQRGRLRPRLPGALPRRPQRRGVLVVWSAARSPELLAALEDVFGAAEERAYDVLLQDRPEEYFLYVGRRSTSGGPSA